MQFTFTGKWLDEEVYLSVEKKKSNAELMTIFNAPRAPPPAVTNERC